MCMDITDILVYIILTKDGKILIMPTINPFNKTEAQREVVQAVLPGEGDGVVVEVSEDDKVSIFGSDESDVPVRVSPEEAESDRAKDYMPYWIKNFS